MVHLLNRIPVAVIGSGKSDPGSSSYKCALAIGRGLANRHYAVLCGARSGIMAAAAQGCREAGGLCIGLLPNLADMPNDYCNVVIATDLGNADNPIVPNISRNRLIVRSALCIFAVGGERGTANELRFAWEGRKRVFGLEGVPSPEGYDEETMTWDHPSGRFSRHDSVEDAFAAFDVFIQAPGPFVTTALPPRT